MKKSFFPSIVILLVASAFLMGCSHSTQVTNNTTNATGPWVGATQSAQFPLVLGDSTGGTLTAVLDTNARTVTGAIYSRNDTNEVIFIGDSGLPTRVIVGTKEIMFANYTDTSVDVVATDTSGSIGVQPAVDIRDLLSKITIHSNKISRTQMKSKVPNSYTLQDFIDEGEIIGTAKDINDCILPIISNLSVIAIPFVGPNPAILLSGWFHPPDFDACQSLFNKIMDALQNSGAFKTPPSAPPIQEAYVNPDKPWEAANSLDQYISNMPPYWAATAAVSVDTAPGAGGGCTFSNFSSGGQSGGLINPPSGIDFLPFVNPPISCYNSSSSFSYGVQGPGTFSTVLLPSGSNHLFGTFSATGRAISGSVGFGNAAVVGSFRR